MAWIETKTNWKHGDTFDRAPDYERLCGNLTAIYEKGTPLCAGFGRVRVPLAQDVPEHAWATAELFNAVEDAVAQLVFYIGLLPQYVPQRFATGQPVWTAEDLNRLERTLCFLNKALHAAAVSAPTLQFTLGGDAIA